ncbi:MAG: hypothetical protein ACNA8R_15045 [Nitriliruptoraceae bacterium]
MALLHPAATTTSTPALDRLRPREQAGLLPALLAAHPELAATREALASARVRDVDADERAEELAGRLNDLSCTEFAARAGKQPGYYVHETDAANEIVAGLHRCCDGPDGTVLADAGPDTPVEHAAWLVHKALGAGIELDPDEVESRCPGWILLPDGLRQT